MFTFHPQFITDKTGKKISAILPMKEFKAIVEEFEEMEDIRRYDEAMKSNEPSLPADVVFKMIDDKRKKAQNDIQRSNQKKSSKDS